MGGLVLHLPGRTTLDDDYYGPIWLCALATGMREGELLALRWTDVDLDAGVLLIGATLEPRGTAWVIKERTKSKRRRKAYLDTATVAALRAWRARVAERELAAPVWQPMDLVFPTDTGGIVSPRNLLRHLDLLQEKAKVTRIRFHDLRHTSASIAIQRGVDIKTVSERLGHAGVQITLDTYVHVSQETHARAADVVAAALFRKG